MSALGQQRRQRILEEILTYRNASVVDLAHRVDASEATIRRDLKTLADEGKIGLVHGGATLLRSSDFSFRTKQQRNIEGKRAIGRLAAELVKDDSQIFLDSGSTCFETIPYLKRKRGLFIITNSARVTMELEAPNIHVILIGGQYRLDRMDCVGPLAASTLETLRGYLCFIGADGLSTDFGLSASDVDSAHLNRLAVQNGSEAVLLADHAKFDTPSLYKIVDWNKISRVITDVRPSHRWLSFFQDHGISVLTPETKELETSFRS